MTATAAVTSTACEPGAGRGGPLPPLDEPVSLRRFGLNFDPPSLVLEYERLSTGKLVHRRIGLRRLGPDSNARRTAEKIRRQNEALLAEDQVPFEQLVSVVARLCESRRALDKGKFVPAASSISTAKAKEEEEEEEEQEMHTSTEEQSSMERASTPRGGGLVVDGELDLNKLSTEELDAHKRKMDVAFHKNQKKPGDAGFVYDVRVDHVVEDTAEDCGWDSSEDD